MIYHNYIFFQPKKSFSNLSEEKIKQYKKEFIKIIKSEENILVDTYATLGLKANTAMMFWFQSDSPEQIQNFLNKLLHTELGRYIRITHTLFGMVRPSHYSGNLSATEQIFTRSTGGQYLIIYPFTKTHAWYQLPFEERKNLMKGHISIGRKYGQISQLLLYSFGVDDQEFIVSYESNSLLDFQKLVMELRSDAVRAYTLKDTPIFTCVHKSLEDVLSFL
jgi:chlorite dismutase